MCVLQSCSSAQTASQQTPWERQGGHSSPNWTSTLKARCAYKNCRRLVDVKNVGQSLQVPREDAQEELCRKLRANVGVVKFCSLAHKATTFAVMKKLAPWSAVLMLLQLDTALGSWLAAMTHPVETRPWFRSNESNLSRCEGKLAKHVYPFGMWAVIKLKNPIG